MKMLFFQIHFKSVSICAQNVLQHLQPGSSLIFNMNNIQHASLDIINSSDIIVLTFESFISFQKKKKERKIRENDV